MVLIFCIKKCITVLLYSIDYIVDVLLPVGAAGQRPDRPAQGDR